MWNDLLISAGYAFKGRCRCGGVLKETWSKGTNTIFIYPNRGYFKCKTGKRSLSELESYLVV